LISQFNGENGGTLSGTLKSYVKNAFPWDYFYFVSTRNLQTAQRQCAMVLANNKFINNLVDFSDLKLAPWPDNDILQLACVARLECACKGQDVLLETLSDPYFADKNFHLSFYGSGPDLEHIQTLIEFYKLSDKVAIKGHVNSKNEIWEMNHLLILPSIAEGTPLSLQECMLKGRPAMTTDVGGCAELVIDGQTGFLSPACSQKSLKETLVKVFGTSMADLKTMGIKASEHVNSTINFNPSAVLLDDLTASKS
jgi:glycosyltransferase involved in cell wall biosynthesis